jgi:ligand-binding SRPBCC domain-containing protein
MHIYTLDCEMIVQKDLASVFKVFENPHNLSEITPSWLSFQVLSGEPVKMGKGTRIEYNIRWLGFPLYWRTLITEYCPPYLFIDEQEKGPYRLWRHYHFFDSTEEGTKVHDHVQYALPYGSLGRLTHAALVRDQLRGILNYRQQQLKKLINARTIITELPHIQSE